MKRKNGIKRMLILLPLLLFGAVNVSAADSYTVKAPTKDLEIQFWLDEGVPYYKVVSDGKELIEDAKMGLNTSLGSLDSDITLVGEPVESSGDSTWEPIVGEQETIRDCYNEKVFTLTNSSGTELAVEMRAYDEGVAFRYVLPEVPAETDSYTISDEYTQFVFPEGTMASLHRGNNQTIPQEYAVESLPSGNYQRPATMEYTDGQFLTICEGNLDNYSVMVMKKDSTADRAFDAGYNGNTVTVTADSPEATPWRVLVIGNDATELLEHSTIVMNLNEAADEENYQYSTWVESGTALMLVGTLTTDSVKGNVDDAAAHGIKYVLLDTGWYGPEYDTRCDPRLDPSKVDDENILKQYLATSGGYNDTGEGVFNSGDSGFPMYGSLGESGGCKTNIDIPAVCEYANSKGVGIILYVNGVFFPDSTGRFDTDELFTYFERWGVKGVKPGFVKVRSQSNENYLEEEVLKNAAKHHLILTIHDEYVTTGLERTYPNLMEVEGILGDEGIGSSTPQAAEDIATIFTRTVQGPADHTYCYPGKATKAYALASPLMFRSGMSMLYWYTTPSNIPAQDEGKMEIWNNMPQTWKKSLYLEGEMYEYATIARKSKADEWYIGSLSAVERTLRIPLEFLDENAVYVADIYADAMDADPYVGRSAGKSGAKASQTLINKKYLVTSETTLERELKYGYGYAVKLTKASEEDLAAYEVYNLNKVRVEMEIEKIALLDEENYTEETWGVLAAALQEAEDLLAAEEADDEALEEILAALQEAEEELLSLKGLTGAVTRAKTYLSYRYTAESRAVLEEILADVAQMLAGTFTQQDVDDAQAVLEAAIADVRTNSRAAVKSTTYLSDLEHDKERSSYGEYCKALGKDTNWNKGTLRLFVDGVETSFEKGVGVEAPSNVYYDIEGMGFETFQAYVGVDMTKQDMGDIIFKVYGDGELLYASNTSGTGANDAQFFSIPVAGVKELRLEGDMNGASQGDWADWADAKFLTYEEPEYEAIQGITVDGEAIAGFKASTLNYTYKVDAENAEKVPEITLLADASVRFTVEAAEEVPGCTRIKVTLEDGSLIVYRIFLQKVTFMEYLSDLSDDLIVENTLLMFKKDKPVEGTETELELTAENGVDKISFTKGIGTHADQNTTSQIIYNIEGKGYEYFEGYVGIRYAKNDARSSINFKIYVDDETEPRFESGVMGYRTPAKAYSVDVSGAKRLRLVADALGDQSADHGTWADAKFTAHKGVANASISGTVYAGDTGMSMTGLTVLLYGMQDDKMESIPIAAAVTDENGAYIFETISTGFYTVKIEASENNQEAVRKTAVVSSDRTGINLTLAAPTWDKEKAAEVDAKIAAIGEVTLDEAKIAEIQSVREAYEALSDTAKSYVTKLALLEACEYKLEYLEILKQAEDAAGEAKEAQAAAEAAKTAAEEAKAAAETSKGEAETAKAAAEEAKTKAEEAQTKAETAQTKAEEAQKKAEEAQTKAETAKTDAETAKADAIKAKEDAEAAQAEALRAKEDAALAKQAAETAKAAAEEAQTKAEQAQTKAEEAQTKAETAQMAAETAKAAAQTAQAAAEGFKNDAESFKNDAEGFKNAAETAKTEAAAALADAVKAKTDALEAQGGAESAAGEAQAAKAAAELAKEAAQEAQGVITELLKKTQEEMNEKLKAAEEKLAEAETKLAESREMQKKLEVLLAKAEFKEKEAVLKSAKSRKKKQLKVTWKKIEDAEGYVIQYARKASFKGAKSITVKQNTKFAKTVKKLKRKKVYYVRIRAYKTIDGEVVYTKTSVTKKVRIK